MSETVSLVNGKYIVVDECDKPWIDLENWRWVIRTYRGVESVFIESTEQSQRYLHNQYFPHNTNFRIDFENGDPFDYRRENLIKVFYYKRKSRKTRARGKQPNRIIKQANVGVIENRCTIAPTSEIFRSLLCSTCSLLSVHYNVLHYEACLDIASDGLWNGWDVVERGEWCNFVEEKLREMQEEEEKKKMRIKSRLSKEMSHVCDDI